MPEVSSGLVLREATLAAKNSSRESPDTVTDFLRVRPGESMEPDDESCVRVPSLFRINEPVRGEVDARRGEFSRDETAEPWAEADARGEPAPPTRGDEEASSRDGLALGGASED